MKAEGKYKNQSLGFWAVVKYASEQVGYATRKTRANPVSTLRCPSPGDIRNKLLTRGIDPRDTPEDTFILASEYIAHRARILTEEVEPVLMDRAKARDCYNETRARLNPTLPQTMNRQKGDKKHAAYLASMVAMFAEQAFGPEGFVNDAQKMAILTDHGALKGIFSRRFDGAIPSTKDPIAVWEVKEYYGTTSFGSRVADGVYETLLDGYEINAFEALLGRRIKHYLFVDDRFTWWGMGKPYLCRIIDMLHTGHVDEVFFGNQVTTQWPLALTDLKRSLLGDGEPRVTRVGGP